MNVLQIQLDPTSLYQRQVLNLTVEGKTKRVIFETRYLEITDKWYVSVFDAQTGDPYCTYVPLIATYDTMVDLFEPFVHKRIGWLMCQVLADSPSSENPGKDNLDEFGLYWGDSLE